MKCPKCQFENRESAAFCGKCSAELVRVCAQCGAENPPENNFCDKCASSLSEPIATIPVDYSEPQSYTPRYLADKILTTRSSIEGERKLVTVLFADVANFTSISEKLDPEEVHQIMDGCFRILMDEIHKYEGTINQFTGDGIMALFGAPVAHEDHAQRSCYAALAVQKSINAYGNKIERETGVEFKMRIGLNSGQVIVGSIGDDLRMDYTAVGDTTNLADRMQGLAEPGTILLSRDTHRLARDYFEVESIGKVEIKGKEEEQEAFRLIKQKKIGTRFEASVAKGLTPFVGRKNSMAAMMEAYEKVKSRSGQVVGIVGEAGVGKSRLLLEFMDRISQDDFFYFEGRCLHYGSSMAYLPILDILRSYFEFEEGDREYVVKQKIRDKSHGLDQKLENTIIPFQELLSLTVDDENFTKIDPQQKRIITFEAIRDLFIRLSGENTLILVIEDLHWFDKTTEEFLDYFIGWLASTPILLILLYRPEYTHQWGSKSFYNRIGLDQLTIKSSAELVQAVLEDGDIAPELRDLILDRAAGNPLFMEELTYTLLENGSIQKINDHYGLNKDASEIRVPDTIQGIIAARMDRLEDNLKRTMQIASVIGRDFAFRVLQIITGMRDELKSYLLNLQGLEFIYEKSLFPELEYIFKHALIQDVAYNSLLIARRKEIHENIGTAIETINSERLEEFYEILAHHYSRSDNHEKAYYYLKLSGDKSVDSYSNWEAYRFYLEAIEVLKKMSESEESKRKQIDIHCLIGNLMMQLGVPQDMFQSFEEGEKLSKEVGDSKNLAAFYNFKAIYFQMTGKLELGLKYSEETFKEAEKIQDIELIVDASNSLFMAYLWFGQFYKISLIAPGIIDLLEKTKKTREMFNKPINAYLTICGLHGFSLACLGDFDEGISVLEKGIRNAELMDGKSTLN